MDEKNEVMENNEMRNKYESLLSLAMEVKQDNTDEFIRYWRQELQKHLNFLGLDKIKIEERTEP